METILQEFVIALIKIVILFAFLMFNAAYLTWVERKVIGHMQVRLGPMRTGPHGLLQPIADGIKMFFKEDIIPANADKPVFYLAPIIPIITVPCAFAVMPMPFLGKTVYTIADLNIGILYILALSSLGAYGTVLAGWASNSKYSLLGGLRGSAQIISYEVALGLSLVGPIMMAGSANLGDIVNAQARSACFIFYQPVGFVIFLLAAIAETNRTPFDMPEAESELVAGFATEYSGFRYALFFIGEYIGLIMMAALGTICFLGGWSGIELFDFVPPVIRFLFKMYLLIFLFIWLRATLPRVRFDQLMNFGWRILIPVALANIVVTTLIKGIL